MAKKTILFVDDEKQIRELVSALFGEEAEEIQLITASDGAHGLAVLQSDAHIDLLVTDVVMPGGIDGFDLAYRAKQLRPDLSVIYISGFVKQLPWGERGIGYGPLLLKPLRMEHFRTAVKRALGSSS